jgi:hypothetical protein
LSHCRLHLLERAQSYSNGATGNGETPLLPEEGWRVAPGWWEQ